MVWDSGVKKEVLKTEIDFRCRLNLKISVKGTVMMGVSIRKQ